MQPEDLAAPAGELRNRASRLQSELERLLQTLVEIESHASQPVGVNAVARRVVERLKQAGFQGGPIDRPDVLSEPQWLRDLMLPATDYADVGDVWRLRRPGRGDPVLVLGDLDTAFLPGITSQFPFSTEGDLAFGPGIADMKGGLVVLVGAFAMLRELDYPLPPTAIILSPDEQAGSLASRQAIEQEVSGSAACICLECAREGGNLMGWRASCGVGRIKVIGREAHAGTAHNAGHSGVKGFAGAVDALEGLTDPAQGRFVTITQVRAGWRRSVIPAECEFTLDVRSRDTREWARLAAQIREVLAERVESKGFQVDVQMACHRPGVMRTARSEPLIQTVVAAGRALNLDFGIIASNAAGSSAFAGAIPVIDGMGPPGSDLMTRRENISRSGLLDRACLLALTLISLGRTRDAA